MATADTGCSVCTITTEVTEAILKIDTKIRQAGTILGIYVLVIIAITGIIVYLATNMYTLYRQWRVMAASADPVVDSITVGGAAYVSLGDDELYMADVENPVDEPSVRDKVNQGMDALEATYAEYNKQITEHSLNVLRKPADDLINRTVLDRTNDDFK